MVQLEPENSTSSYAKIMLSASFRSKVIFAYGFPNRSVVAILSARVLYG